MRAALLMVLNGLALGQAPELLPEVVHNDGSQILIQRGRESWRIDLSRLIRNNDCAYPNIGPEPLCSGRRTAPCPDCPRRSGVVGWDLRHQRVFFAIETGTSKNNPWTIFSYSLRTRRVTRFTNTWAASIEQVAASPSGRYLASVNYYHGGICANSSGVEVVDLWEHRLATVKSAA